MDVAEFDRFAEEYEAQHRANIAITGESPEYFAQYKIAELARIIGPLKAQGARIFDFGSGTGNSIPFFREYFPGARTHLRRPFRAFPRSQSSAVSWSRNLHHP